MNNEDVKRQFMLAEQFGGMGGAGTGPHSATWKQQMYNGVPSAAVMQQRQVPAYRPMIDPAMAAAMALHEQQQALALQQLQQQYGGGGDAYDYYLASTNAAAAAAAAAQGHHAHTAAVAAAAAAMAAQRAASGLYPEPRMAY